MRGTLVAALVLSILVTLFVLKNNYQIDINYLLGDVRVSLPFLLFLLLALGSLITLLVSLPSWYRKRKLINSLNKTIDDLTKQLSEVQSQSPKTYEESLPQKDVDDFTKDVETEY